MNWVSSPALMNSLVVPTMAKEHMGSSSFASRGIPAYQHCTKGCNTLKNGLAAWMAVWYIEWCIYISTCMRHIATISIIVMLVYSVYHLHRFFWCLGLNIDSEHCADGKERMALDVSLDSIIFIRPYCIAWHHEYCNYINMAAWAVSTSFHADLPRRHHLSPGNPRST